MTNRFHLQSCNKYSFSDELQIFEPVTPVSASLVVHSTEPSVKQTILTLGMAANNAYFQPIPALTPLASGLVLVHAPAVAQGDPLNDINLIGAELEHSSRKMLHEFDLASVDEVRAAKHRKQTLEIAHNFAGAAPAWAQVNMHLDLQQQMNDLQHTQQETQNYFGYYEARFINRMSARVNQSIVVPHKSTGVRPTDTGVWFPTTVQMLQAITDDQAAVLLNFYGLPVDGNLIDKRNRLKNYFGFAETFV
jgi:hypothetical protein